MKTIGILGGLGPGAGAQLYQNIIKEAQLNYGAYEDSEHPPVILHSTALSGFDAAASLDNPDTKQELLAALKGIEAAGADYIVMACNTIHLLHDEMQASLNIPLLHLINEVINLIPKNCKKVGVISSEQSSNGGLYAEHLEKSGRLILAPTVEQQDSITRIIATVMAGTYGVAEKAVLQRIIHDLHQIGAEVIVLGCTELPLVISPEDVPDLPVIDSLRVAAKICVSKSIKF